MCSNYLVGLWLRRGVLLVLQISKELKQYHHVERLDDVRVIKDRQTSMHTQYKDFIFVFGKVTDPCSEVSRGFGFLRFPTLEEAKAFLERNYPMIYLYGRSSTDIDDEAAKVRIAFSRERDDRGRGEKADGEWTCKIV